MNIQKIVSCLILIFAHSQLTAQDNIVKVNIVSPVVSTITAAYERSVFDKKTSIQGNLSITYGYEIDDEKLTGWAFGVDYRRYLWTIAKQNGIYFSPFIRYQHFGITKVQTEKKRTSNVLTGGVIFGRQWIFSRHLVLDAFAGPSLNSASLKPTDTSIEVEKLQGLRLRAGFSVGYLF